MRGRIGENEWHGLSRGHREFADGGQVLTDEVNRRPQHDHVRAGDSPQRAVVEPRDPGHDCAVAEAQHKLGAHCHLTLLAHHETNHARAHRRHRHEIDECDHALAAFETSFQNQRVRPISTGDGGPAITRRDLPMSVITRAEKRGEAGVRIEAWPTQPVERAIARDERGRLAIAD
jgi:hypothetical protein